MFVRTKQRIRQKQHKYAGAYSGEDAETVSVSTESVYMSEVEPLRGQQIVDGQTEGYAANDYRRQVYSSAGLRPISREISVNDAKLAAGPAISNTRAVPGDRPFSISDMAIGIEPVAHTYMGMAITSTAIIENMGVLPRAEKSRKARTL